MRKTKIPPKSMQRVQISQMLEPVNDKNEIWVASPSEDLPKYVVCEEQIINYEKGEGYIWVTNTHENDLITLSKGTCLVEIQIVSEADINNWKNSEKNLVNNINVHVDKEYPLTRSQFLEKFELSHITDDSLKQKLCDLLWEYRDVFSTSEDDIRLIPFYEHAIQTTGPPVAKQPYRIPYKHKEWLINKIHELEKNRIIKPSISPYSAPAILVPKKNNDLRLVVDYRALNKQVVSDKFPLPRIDEILDSISNKNKIFTSLDLTQGYHQVKIAQGDVFKTDFSTTECGSYEYLKVPFGLKTSSSALCRPLLHLLRGLNNIIHFVDDVIAMDKYAEDHLVTLAKVFEKFREGNLKCRPEKVNLFQTKLKFLGVVVTQGQISPDPEKIKSVKNIKPPQTIKQLRGILGLMNYFRKFIRNYAQIAKPLTDLTRGNPQKIVWSKTAQNALDHLKKALTSEPILSLPDFQTGQFVVTTDASNKGIGAILSQIINGEERVIAYASRTLISGESNYSATQLELLSIIHHLDKFRHYLVGRKFKLRSDHKSLQYLQTFKKPSGILARWILKIQDLDYEFEHLKGKQNAPCDYLSRFPDNTPVENENEEVNTIKAKIAPKNENFKTKTSNSVEKEQKNSPLSLNSIKIGSEERQYLCRSNRIFHI